MASAWDQLRARLENELQALYRQQDLTGAQLAARILAEHPDAQWSQPKVSSLLRVKRAPQPGDARLLARAMGASETTAAEIEGLAERLRDEKPRIYPSRQILDQGGSANFQRRLRRIQQQAAAVVTYHPGTIHGLLQTEAMVAAIIEAQQGIPPGSPQSLEFVEVRRANQADALASDRHYTMLVPAAALWGAPALLDEQGMAEQAQRIIDVSRDYEKRWEIGVIPLGRHPVGQPVFGLHGFDLHLDQRGRATSVLFGTHSGTAHLDDENELAKYVSLVERLRQHADFGEKGRAHVSLVRDHFAEKAARRGE